MVIFMNMLKISAFDQLMSVNNIQYLYKLRVNNKKIDFNLLKSNLENAQTRDAIYKYIVEFNETAQTIIDRTIDNDKSILLDLIENEKRIEALQDIDFKNSSIYDDLNQIQRDMGFIDDPLICDFSSNATDIIYKIEDAKKDIITYNDLMSTNRMNAEAYNIQIGDIINEILLTFIDTIDEYSDECDDKLDKLDDLSSYLFDYLVRIDNEEYWFEPPPYRCPLTIDLFEQLEEDK